MELMFENCDFCKPTDTTCDMCEKGAKVDLILCPYCGDDNTSQNELMEFEDNLECASCSKPFHFSMEIVYTVDKV